MIASFSFLASFKPKTSPSGTTLGKPLKEKI
jgi:hypothetical protein